MKSEFVPAQQIKFSCTAKKNGIFGLKNAWSQRHRAHTRPKKYLLSVDFGSRLFKTESLRKIHPLDESVAVRATDGCYLYVNRLNSATGSTTNEALQTGPQRKYNRPNLSCFIFTRSAFCLVVSLLGIAVTDQIWKKTEQQRSLCEKKRILLIWQHGCFVKTLLFRFHCRRFVSIL